MPGLGDVVNVGIDIVAQPLVKGMETAVTATDVTELSEMIHGFLRIAGKQRDKFQTEAFPVATQSIKVEFYSLPSLDSAIAGSGKNKAITLSSAALEACLGVTAQPHWNLPSGGRIDTASINAVELSFKTDHVTLPQLSQQFDLLVGAFTAGAKIHSKGLELDMVPAYPHAQSQPLA